MSWWQSLRGCPASLFFMLCSLLASVPELAAQADTAAPIMAGLSNHGRTGDRLHPLSSG